VQRSDRPTLLVGRTDRATHERIVREGLAPASSFESFDDGPTAAGWLEQAEPHAILVRLGPDQSERFVFGIRALPRLGRVPVLVLADEISDLTFAQAFAWGADDALGIHDIAGLRRRLASIPADLPHAAPPSRGKAVLAHSDQRSRVLLARVMRNAGFDVRFAVRADELDAEVRDPGVVLVVADEQLEGGDAPAALKRIREQGVTTPWIVMAPPKNVQAVVGRIAGQPGVTVHDSYAAPENLHFVANEVLSGSVSEQRASARLLFNSIIGFRAAGRDTDRLGYTYNISAEGLFVRTLDPLMRGEDVWFELTPPRTDRRVRVEGTVVWTRMLGPWPGATVPPGFGLRITGGSQRDLERFREGYRAFAHDLTGTR